MAFEYQFPDPNTADSDGLLAVGGDLSISALITAYSMGIFPWFSDGSPILWWSPNPRLVLFPEKFKISSSLRQKKNSRKYTVTIDTCFTSVIAHCSGIKRTGQEGTWITKEMYDAYVELHEHGLAHSFETWYNGELAGGLYGVSLGRAFFGESMFYLMPDASKLALSTLVDWCLRKEFHFIDAQQSTAHLKSMGAEEISRARFMKLLNKALESETLRGSWTTL